LVMNNILYYTECYTDYCLRALEKQGNRVRGFRVSAGNIQ